MNKLIALKNIERDLLKKIKQLKSKRVKKQDFSITINDDEYTRENDILDAYGCDIISEAQKDTAIRKYREWENGNVNEVLDYQINYYSDMLYNIRQDILELEEK